MSMTRCILFRCLIGLFAPVLSACAGPAMPGDAALQSTARSAPPEAIAASESGTPPLPRVPQPPERPHAPPGVTDPDIPRAQRIEAFVEYAAATHGVDPERIRAVLATAQPRPAIVTAMNRPAEAVRQWHEYRPIFLNQARIGDGIAFYRQHRQTLDAVAAESGVPAEYIVAIIGVETSYGRITGNYRVLDALYTLAFDYPKRAPFFAAELAHLFALAEAEPQLDLTTLKGSYAGAMGLGQFMPSSYRLWARDGDGDGQRDLISNLADVFASIANYFLIHGWEPGAPVIARAHCVANMEPFTPDTLEPIYRLEALAALGCGPLPDEPQAEGANLITLKGVDGPEHWIIYRNFYVITRYNRSPMYALSVHQLAEAIRAGVDGA